VRFNRAGTHLLALRRRLPPVLYSIDTQSAVCQFDSPGYYNSCTMKSCSFAGDQDQFILSGSDDFNLYLWKIPDECVAGSTWVEKAHMVLHGHRSIVNQVRFNHHNFVLASSGVEKIIKLWSPFEVPGSSGGLERDSPSHDRERKVYSHEEYIDLVLRSGQVMSHDYSHQSIQEDPRMMAFFDSLVQREIEGSTSDSSVSSINTESWLYSSIPDNLSELRSTTELSSDAESDNNAGAASPPRASVAPPQPAEQPAVEQPELGANEEINLFFGDDGSSNSFQNVVTVSGVTDTPNRISQLIAQKRNLLKQAAMEKMGSEEKAQGTRKSKRTLTNLPVASKTVKRRIESSSSSSSDSGTNDNNPTSSTANPIKISFNFAPNNNSKDRRKQLRKRRAKVLNELSDSDSDDASNVPAKQMRRGNQSSSEMSVNANVEGRTICPCVLINGSCSSSNNNGDAVTNGASSSAGTKANTMSACTICSSESENKETPSEELADSVTGVSAGTPDSGIASHGCDTVETASSSGTSSVCTSAASQTNPVCLQFRRVKSRTERSHRQYRSRNSCDGPNSD